MFPRIIIFLAVLIGLVSAAGARAQDVATPTAPVECTVEPRTLEEIAAIQASPAAEATPVATGGGEPVDDATLAEIELALRVANACALAGDYERLAGAYSDAAIAEGVLDEEGVPIVPGTPEATPITEPGKYGSAVVVSATWINDRHVLVQIERGPTVRELRMVREDGRWLIDSAETVIDTVVTDGVGTPDASAVLPIEVMQAVVDLVAMETGEEVSVVTIVSVKPVDWPDTFLGCPVEGQFAAQVITPGYRVIVQLEDRQLEVHTDLRGNAVTC